jgi:signal transduction histidine kinase
VTTESPNANAPARVESLLFIVRWVVLALVLPVAYYDKGTSPFTISFWVWVAGFVAYNLMVGLSLRFASRFLPSAGITLAVDALFFGVLPYLLESESNALALFVTYPALVGAIRFGPRVGLITAVVLALPIEARIFVPIFSQRNPSGLAAAIPFIGLMATVGLIGFLSLREREAALGVSSTEVAELRRANEGAHLLYKSIEELSTTTSYEPVLDAMLEAGLKGLPSVRPQEGLPVGITLIFDDLDPERPLQVVASRNLSRRDSTQRLAGKSGIVAETLKQGSVIIFDDVKSDPELAIFAAIRRCRAGACYPLQAGLEQYGVVVLAGVSQRQPSSEYLSLMLAFTHQAAIAFQTAKLYNNLRTEHDQIIRSENEIRLKLARDLHDGPTQKVSAIVMQAEHIGKLIDRDPLEAKKEIAQARKTAEAAMKELRTALFILRPLTLETKGLSAAIKQYCERLESENVTITVDPGEFGSELDPNLAATTFSIVEEATNNARKYARGTPINVSLSRQNNLLVAVVEDSGPGFDLNLVTSIYNDKASLGLQTMRERSALIDGDLRIDTAPGRGTRVTLVVPLPKATAPTAS